MANDLEKKISSQIEYYFGDINLPRDKFLQEKIKEDEGWVQLEVLLTFKRLASLSTDLEVIASAVEKSDKKLVEVSEDRKKFRRTLDNPLPEFNEERKKELMGRTAYAKGFASEDKLDDIVSFLEPHGPIESCFQRTYLDKATNDRKFKGSCYIIFKEIETCKKFIDAECIKYKDNDLKRLMQEEYMDLKKKEVEERKSKKKGNKPKEDVPEPKEEKCDIPDGAVVHFAGIKAEETLTREEIKEKIAEVSKVELVYVDYSKGLSEGYLRFNGENSACDFYKELTDSKLTIGEIELTFKLLEADEEKDYRKRYIEARKQQAGRRKQQYGGKFNNRKRRGNFGDRDGPRSKK